MKCTECGHPTASEKDIERAINNAPKSGVNKHYDIPYIAGYSKDGTIDYIDRHFPSEIDYKGKKVDILPYILEHENVEKQLIHELGFHYLHAHHIAIAHEDKKVLAEHDKEFLKAYNAHCKKYEKQCEDERITKTPKKLDLTPYQDEHDKDLKRIKEAMV